MSVTVGEAYDRQIRRALARGRREMLDREPEPRACVRAPQGLLVRSGVDAEQVWHACVRQLRVQPFVLSAEAGVATPDVEREERRQLTERAPQRRHEAV